MIPLGRTCNCWLKGDEPRICSHVAMQVTKAGEPLYVDLACLEKAANLKGFDLVHDRHYTWYNRHVGDYPVPPGINVKEIGKNAKFVLRMNAANEAKFVARHGRKPYDVGFVEDPNNEGAFCPIYDFYQGGYGVDELLGSPVYGQGGSISLLCPQLKQTYDMVCDSVAGGESLDTIKFFTRKELSEKRDELQAEFPEVFAAMTELLAPSKDETTWVSIATTEARLGIK